jgi:hypothetical protein
LACKSPVEKLVSDLTQELENTFAMSDIIVVKFGPSHQRDIMKLGAADELLKVSGIDVFGTPCIAGVPEQITVHYVL